MIITAVAVGTRGDVNPLAELGREMVQRGHEFRILAQEAFRPLIEKKGVRYLHLDGDADKVMKYMVTDYKTGLDFAIGLAKLKKENPRFMDQTIEAVKGSDAVMYGVCSGFARHAAELLAIPCIRYFYSPYDRTKLYSLYTPEHNTRAVAKSYDTITKGMALITKLLMNPWRKQSGLKKWDKSCDYTVQNGKKVLTFYPVSPVFMMPDPEWGDHIHVTGYWYHPKEDAAEYEEPEELTAFLEEGERPIFVCFGKAESPELARLQEMTLEVLRETGIKAVFQGTQLLEKEKKNTGKLYFIDNVPYSHIFQKVRAVVHHGGCTTTGLGIWAGCPTLIIPLSLDQYYYGRTVSEQGLGPKPLYIRKKLCTKTQLKEALTELVSGKYDEKAQLLSAKIRCENGVKEAATVIETWGKQAAAERGE